jgi:WD and tetratricopeptide repeat-containing protein 1
MKYALQGRSGDLPTAVARKLALECVLDGHNGCVNRLAWNMEGSMLASASDDCQVRC